MTAAIHVVPGAHRDWNRQERWRPRARTLSDHHNVLPLAEAKKVTFAGARAEPLREAIDLSLWDRELEARPPNGPQSGGVAGRCPPENTMGSLRQRQKVTNLRT